MEIIFSIPSDETVTYPPATSNIDNYDTTSFTKEDVEIATSLMTEHGFEGQPKIVDIEYLSRNLLAIDLTIGKYKVTARQYNFGFSFGYQSN